MTHRLRGQARSYRVPAVLWDMSKKMKTKRIHPWPVRLTHWLNAFGMTCMFMSGWAIYNASPLFAFRFPPSFTVGGWLGGALAWHFAVMWLLFFNGLIYVLYGLFSRHLRGSPSGPSP